MLAALALAAAAAAAPPNLLLVTIDTLRADRLRCYGYGAIETPATDRLAREGVLLEDAVVQVPQTRPSHASILTGREPYEHGVRDNFSPPMQRSLPTLATILKTRGFETAAFIGAFPLAASSGLGSGFDLYDDRLTPSQGPGGAFLAQRRGAEVVDSALRWLKRDRTRPFFAWVHLYDPHTPYDPPAPYERRYAGRLYDGEVAYADAQVGRLLAWLDEKALAARTLVVVTSDHGEGLGEHGEDEHLMFVYDSTLKVPLLVSWPGVLPAGRRIAGQFRSVDLLPTILDLMRIPAVATSGLSRASQVRAGQSLPDNDSYAESLYGELHFGYAPLRALRAAGWKYVEAPRAELYDLRTDPGEQKSLLESRGATATQMRERVLAHEKREGAAPRLEAPADAGALEQLVALGYVGGGGGARPGAVQGVDPKDKIAEYQAYTRDVQKVVHLSRQGDVDGALPILERLARKDSVSVDVQYFLGRALLRKKRYAEAVQALEEARALLPRFVPIYVELAQAFRLQGKLREARAVVERGLEVSDQSAALWEEGGLVAQRQGETAVAQAAFERTRNLDPGSVRARLALSAQYRDQGKLDAAIAEVREATRREPKSVAAWNALGVLLCATGRAPEADEAFRAGLKLKPDDPDLLFNLADLLLQAGPSGEAVVLLERTVAAAPEFEEARRALERARQASEPPPPGRLRLRLIRVRERSTAESIAAELQAGGDFATLARASSIDPTAPGGGLLGDVDPQDLSEPLHSAAAALAPGERSAILETPSGYALLRRER